jgi:hypothetical protein
MSFVYFHCVFVALRKHRFVLKYILLSSLIHVLVDRPFVFCMQFYF